MVSNPRELPFLWMQFEEAASEVDLIVVTEFGYTHSGKPRQSFFHLYAEEFRSRFPQLLYLFCPDIPGLIFDAQTPDEQHHNENLMRAWFVEQVRVASTDFVVAPDADEVLYAESFRWMRENCGRSVRGFRFRLHQFMYRPNWLWLEQSPRVPSILRFGSFRHRSNFNWRYRGEQLSGFWGCHFSWCIPVEEMVQKVESYAHSADYSHLVSATVLRNAVQSKTYPFEPERPFSLIELDFDSEILPASFSKYRHLIHPEVLGLERKDS